MLVHACVCSVCTWESIHVCMCVHSVCVHNVLCVSVWCYVCVGGYVWLSVHVRAIGQSSGREWFIPLICAT